MQKKKKQTKGRREKARDRMRETRTRHNISRMVMAVIGLVSQGKILFALFLVNVYTESKLLCFQKQNVKRF